MNPFPQKKIMTFNKHIKDFTFHVNYQVKLKRKKLDFQEKMATTLKLNLIRLIWGKILFKKRLQSLRMFLTLCCNKPNQCLRTKLCISLDNLCTKQTREILSAQPAVSDAKFYN